VNIETTFNEINPLDCVRNMHAYFPVLPNLLWMNEIIELSTEYEKIGDVCPEHTVN